MTHSCPVLMYHKVGAPVQSPADRFLNVDPRAFERQMALLRRLGYRAIPFSEVVAAVSGGRVLPPRAVAITFDDGYQCVGDVVAPILERLGFVATVFVVSRAAGQCNDWDRVNGRPVSPLLGWDVLRSLNAAGWEIGGHTATHPRLDQLTDTEALHEIVLGKQEAEERLGVRLLTFCYPFGGHSRRTPELVRQAGFSGACTVRSGLAYEGVNPYLIPRVKIASRDNTLGFLYRLLMRPHLPDLRARRHSPSAMR